MIIFHKQADLQNWAAKNAGIWRHCGFVPTMGALHDGHIALVKQSKNETPLTIASIFVNPSQFNDPADFEKYPVTLDSDIRALESAGCDLLFLPGTAEIYPGGWKNGRHYPLDNLENLLEGHYRPGHFQGVCQVVHRLLDLVKPARLFMGQKDYQQCMVVNRLIELENLPVELVTCPTVRETDGLAMSSRNLRLTAGQRPVAAAIFREMTLVKEDLARLPLRMLEQRAAANLISAGFRAVDYVSVADARTLEPLQEVNPSKKAVVLAAAFLGEIRLIDNLVLN